MPPHVRFERGLVDFALRTRTLSSRLPTGAHGHLRNVRARPCAASMTVWRPSRAGSVAGKSARACAPRVSSRSSARGRDEPRERVRVVEQRRAGRRRRARGRRAATSPCGSRASARERSRPCGGGARRRAAAARRAPRSAARRPNTKHSDSELEASRLAPCRPVQAHSPTAYSPATVGAAVEVGDDRRPSRSGSRARPGRARWSGPARPRAARRRRSGSAPGRRAVMSRLTAVVACSRSRRKIARATSSRGASSSTKRSPLASCSVAPSPRIASVIRKPSRPLMPTTAVGWNWVNSRSASVGAGGAGEQQAGAERAGRVGRARPQRGGAAGGEDRRARASSVRPSSSATPCDAAVARSGRGAAAPSRTSMPGVLDDVGRELAQDPPPGRAAARVHDAAGAVAALEPERDVAVAVGVEAHAERLEVAEAGGRLVREHRRRRERRTSPRPALSVSSRCAPGSRRPRARPRARPAPSRTRSRPAAGRTRASRRAPSRAALRQANSPAAPAPTTTRSERSAFTGDAVRYRRADALWLRHERSLGARHPGPSRAAGADPRAGGRDGRARLVRRVAARGAGGRARAAGGGAPGVLRGRDRGAVRARRRVPSTPTPPPCADTWEAALRAAGGAVALVDALLGGAAPHRRVRAAPARPSRRARAGDGLLLLRQRRRWRPRARASAHGVERVLIVDWDVHHGNGTEANLPRRSRRAVRLDPRVAAVSGHRPGVLRRLGARARATRSTCRCPAGSGDAVYRSLVEHVAAR